MSFLDQQRTNRRRSIALVAVFVAFFLWIGLGADLVLFQYTANSGGSGYAHRLPLAGLLTSVLALIAVTVAWRRGPREVLWSTGAWELVEASSDKEREFVNVAEEMAIAAGLPRPTLWIIPDEDPNALATGVKPDDSHVAVTEGLLNTLQRDELQAVVAHEMAHVQNQDVKLMTLLAALVGLLALLSDGTARSLRIGGLKSGRRKGSGPGGAAVILLVLWVISLLLAPFVSRVLALCVSRKREYLADATAAQLTRNPEALADALKKIHESSGQTKSVKRATAHLCIADPLGRRANLSNTGLASIFATHPPMPLRIARLKEMAYTLDRTGELSSI